MDLGGTFQVHAVPLLGVQKICLAWTGNVLKTGKMTRNLKKKKKKRSFWRTTIFDHLSPCGFGDYIINVWS